MVGADQLGLHRVALADDGVDVAADLLALVPAAGRVVGEHPLRAAQVGHAHRREQHAAQLLRRERDRHAQDAAEDAVVAQDVPERAALAQEPDGRPAEGDLILAQAEDAPGRPDLDRAELRVVVRQVGREEVEDVVLARVRPRSGTTTRPPARSAGPSSRAGESTPCRGGRRDGGASLPRASSRSARGPCRRGPGSRRASRGSSPAPAGRRACERPAAPARSPASGWPTGRPRTRRRTTRPARSPPPARCRRRPATGRAGPGVAARSRSRVFLLLRITSWPRPWSRVWTSQPPRRSCPASGHARRGRDNRPRTCRPGRARRLPAVP